MKALAILCHGARFNFFDQLCDKLHTVLSGNSLYFLDVVFCCLLFAKIPKLNLLLLTGLHDKARFSKASDIRFRRSNHSKIYNRQRRECNFIILC